MLKDWTPPVAVWGLRSHDLLERLSLAEHFQRCACQTKIGGPIPGISRRPRSDEMGVQPPFWCFGCSSRRTYEPKSKTNERKSEPCDASWSPRLLSCSHFTGAVILYAIAGADEQLEDLFQPSEMDKAARF